MKSRVFIEFLRLAFDTGIVLENQREIGSRTSAALDEIDRYFYATISILLKRNERPYVPFKWIYLYMKWSVLRVSLRRSMTN